LVSLVCSFWVVFSLVFLWVGRLIYYKRLGKADIVYFKRQGLIGLDVIALGLEILFTHVPFFYIAYLNIFFPPSKPFLLSGF
jgi:hypothetical protein